MSLRRTSFPFAAFLLSVLFLTIPATAQTAKVEHTASISGRVTINGQPAAGVMVILLTGQRQSTRDEPITKTSTNAEGRFQLLNLASGSYRVGILAPGYLNAIQDNPYRAEQTVNLEENDTIDNIDFSLKRGGVITGSVIDANHQPVIEASVTLRAVGERGQPAIRYEYNGETDDRGVYRIFGLPAGHYKVRVNEFAGRRVANSDAYPSTYYPNTKEEAKAGIVAVPDGGEVSNIDIRIGEITKNYAIFGRMLDVETGKPMAGLRYGLSTLMPNENVSNGSTIFGTLTNANGEFRIGGILAGRYAVFAANGVDSNIYSEPVIVEITDADVKVEIKTRHGASINGYVLVEGANDAKDLNQLSQFFLYTRALNQTNTPTPSVRLNASDRSFHLTGLRPGTYALDVSMMNFSNFFLSRIEKDGVEIKNLEVREGEQVNDVRVFVGYGKGVIRGQVKVESGEFPDLSGLAISAKRKGDTMGSGYKRCAVDIRGNFVLEGLAPGEYELSLGASSRKTFDALSHMQNPKLQTVTVTNDAESHITIVLQARD